MPKTRLRRRRQSSSESSTSQESQEDTVEHESEHHFSTGKSPHKLTSHPKHESRSQHSQDNTNGRQYVGSTSVFVPRKKARLILGNSFPYRDGLTSDSGFAKSQAPGSATNRVVALSQRGSDVLLIGPPKRGTKKMKRIQQPVSASVPTSAVGRSEESSARSEQDEYYEALGDEVAEDAQLNVYKETNIEQDEGESDSGGVDRDVPIRVLTAFTIYERDTSRLIPIETLLESADLKGYEYCASGRVHAWVDDDDTDYDDDDDDDDDGTIQTDDLSANAQMVSLSKIIEVNVHHVPDGSEGSRNFNLDSKIYIRTKFAWYILRIPAKDYLLYYSPFWIKQQLFHQLLTSTFENRRLTYATFLETLEECEASDLADTIIGHRLGEEHFTCEETEAYIISTFNDLCEDYTHLRSLRKTPILTDIFKSDLKPSSRSKSKGKPRLKDIEKNRQVELKTIVTRKVYAVAKKLFPTKLFVVVGADLMDGIEESVDVSRHQTHKSINEIQWDRDTRVVPDHYRVVLVDGVRYEVGDTVMVDIGEDTNTKRSINAISGPSISTNLLANDKWFGHICYMYEKDTKKFMHLQWYQHGSKILLQETAHPQALFLTDECDDVLIESIYQKANLRVLGSTEEEPPVAPDTEENSFYTGLRWDKQNHAFFERTEEKRQQVLQFCKCGKPCESCGQKRLLKERQHWTVKDDLLRQGDVHYHIDDFVYIRPAIPKTDVYIIGQITRIHRGAREKAHTVDIRVFERYDLVARLEKKSQFAEHETDQRRLFRTGKVYENESVSAIEGKLYVVHSASLSERKLEKWVSHDDHFYVDLQSKSSRPKQIDFLEDLPLKTFKRCEECYGARRELLEIQKTLEAQHEPLRGLELFSGAGGLSAGLDQSGFVKTKWAVEWTTSAAMSYAANHPETVVYNQCVNACLKHAVDTEEGKSPEPLPSLNKRVREKLPPMPKPGEVDFIYGGPPCQGYSKMNHHKKADDHRNTLICNMLSYVDFYRPKFFLLENVDGLFDFNSNAEQNGNRTVGGYKMGAVKFILSAMISLGYQIHFRLLNAGQYGAPQSRLRVIFLGAKRYLPLPMFPIPTHCTADDVYKRKLPTGDTLYPLVRFRPYDADPTNALVHLQYAPLLPVTVEDAISDLPKFDWIDPHVVFASTDNDLNEIGRRHLQGIKRFSVVPDPDADSIRPYCGYNKKTPYVHEPLNRYQRWIRSGSDQVAYHYTARFRSNIVERTVWVPLVPDANYTELPRELLIGTMMGSQKKHLQTYKSLFRRIDGKGQFKTALTTVNPNCKTGHVLHPTQKRVITVREAARAQGFPDSWEFVSEQTIPAKIIQDQFRQIGNAVPVPLALALGKSVGSALVGMWHEDDLREQVGREHSPEVPMNIE